MIGLNKMPSKYGVEIIADSVLSLETDNFETARLHAISLSNWNIECQIIDMETKVTLKYFMAYNKLKVNEATTSRYKEI